MTINEVRALDDLSPLDFGDVLYDQAKNLQLIPDLKTNPEMEMEQKSVEEEITLWKGLQNMPKIDKDFDESAGLFICPKEVADVAQSALDAKEEYGDKVVGGLAVGWTRARQLANREKISYNTIRRMKSFFDRHDGNQKIDDPKNKEFPWADGGHTAWQIWGGNPGRQWAEDVINYVETELDNLEENGDE